MLYQEVRLSFLENDRVKRTQTINILRYFFFKKTFKKKYESKFGRNQIDCGEIDKNKQRLVNDLKLRITSRVSEHETKCMKEIRKERVSQLLVLK